MPFVDVEWPPGILCLACGEDGLDGDEFHVCPRCRGPVHTECAGRAHRCKGKAEQPTDGPRRS